MIWLLGSASWVKTTEKGGVWMHLTHGSVRVQEGRRDSRQSPLGSSAS